MLKVDPLFAFFHDTFTFIDFEEGLDVFPRGSVASAWPFCLNGACLVPSCFGPSEDKAPRVQNLRAT